MKHTQDELKNIIAGTRAVKRADANAIKVTTLNGHTFDGHDEARGHMSDAITASALLGVTEHRWKLADNTTAVVSLAELREAHALAIQAKGVIILR